MAFVYQFFGPNGYPSVSFGPGCTNFNSTYATEAPGLSNCTAIGDEIAQCQAMGKKVLVSAGGSRSNSSFTSNRQAEQFARTMWDLFGAGTGLDPNLRPFGPNVILDGFDIDNEDDDPRHYYSFARALRRQFLEDDSKTYYLSAAPQCPIPDESIPMNAMGLADFIWVQFYNNPKCNLNTTEFPHSFAAWSRRLSAASGDSVKPRLYIGAEAYKGSGYVRGPELWSVVDQAKQLNVDNMGGMMLW